MSTSRIILPQVTVIQTHIVHHGDHYFLTRIEGSRTVLAARPISAAEAQRMVEALEADPDTRITTRFGEVGFPGSPHWSWIARTVVPGTGQGGV